MFAPNYLPVPTLLPLCVVVGGSSLFFSGKSLGTTEDLYLVGKGSIQLKS